MSPVSRSPAVADDSANASAQATALRLIAAVLIVASAHALGHLLVPFVLALVLAIALSPLADRVERLGLPRVVSALLCTLLVAAAFSLGFGVLVYEAGTVAADSGKYMDQFGKALDKAVARAHAEKTLASLGFSGTEDGGDKQAADRSPKPSDEKKAAGESGTDGPRHKIDWPAKLRGALGSAAGWVLSGVGGLLGALGGLLIMLASLFYMLQTRSEWVDGLQAAGRRLGMNPSAETLGKIRREIVTFAGCLGMVSCAYAVVVTLTLWAIGIPQPLLWGLLAGLFEVVPYFGPLIASILPTLVALSTGEPWKAGAVAGLFLALHTLEGYVITPLLYGRAVKFNPVTILFGALFFGWLWGAVGLATAMPMLILLRGLLLVSPDTPALDALAGIDDENAAPELAAPRA